MKNKRKVIEKQIGSNAKTRFGKIKSILWTTFVISWPFLFTIVLTFIVLLVLSLFRGYLPADINQLREDQLSLVSGEFAGVRIFSSIIAPLLLLFGIPFFIMLSMKKIIETNRAINKEDISLKISKRFYFFNLMNFIFYLFVGGAVIFISYLLALIHWSAAAIGIFIMFFLLSLLAIHSILSSKNFNQYGFKAFFHGFSSMNKSNLKSASIGALAGLLVLVILQLIIGAYYYQNINLAATIFFLTILFVLGYSVDNARK